MIAEERVRCSPVVAASLIESALQRISTGEKLAVRVPADVVGIRNPFALEQEVRFRIARTRDQSGLNDVLTISWEPEGDVFVPAFQGILTSDAADANKNESILALQGSYEAPGGLLGKAFDEAFGFWIARATMHDLLKRLARAIEALDAARSTSTATAS